MNMIGIWRPRHYSYVISLDETCSHQNVNPDSQLEESCEWHLQFTSPAYTKKFPVNPEPALARLIQGDLAVANDAMAPEGRNKLSLVTKSRAPMPPSREGQPSNAELRLQIREARTREDKAKLYHFRYLHCGAETLRNQNYVNHACKRIKEDLDVNAVNLLALHRSRIVGVIRINYAWRCALGTHADFYRMREIAGLDYPSGTCLISWLMVDPQSRGNALGYQLCAAAYEHALERGVRHAFLHCRDNLIYYFSSLGFKAYMGRTLHAEHGEVLPMTLDLLDEQYLMRIGSPLLPRLRSWKRTKQPGVQIRPV